MDKSFTSRVLETCATALQQAHIRRMDLMGKVERATGKKLPELQKADDLTDWIKIVASEYGHPPIEGELDDGRIEALSLWILGKAQSSQPAKHKKAKTFHLTDTDKEILEVLGKLHYRMNGAQIAVHISADYNYLRKRLSVLKKEGLIDRTQQGYTVVTKPTKKRPKRL